MMGHAAGQRADRMRSFGLDQLLSQLHRMKMIRDGLLEGAAEAPAERHGAVHLLLRQDRHGFGQFLGFGPRYAGKARDFGDLFRRKRLFADFPGPQAVHDVAAHLHGKHRLEKA